MKELTLVVYNFTMKFSIYLLQLIFILSCSAIHAQVFSFGLKGGINSSNIDGDYSLQSDSKTGMNLGAFANFNFTKNFGVVSEFNFERKGFSYHSDLETSSEYIEGERSFDYFSVPILFRYQFGSSTKFYITIGTYMGILLAARDIGFSEDRIATPVVVTNWDTNIYRDTQDVDVGLCFGTGFQIPINTRFGIIVDGRYK
ncbi:MAG: PorT family protein [Bacteroidetes bacterium]|nr:PorT family protein [Bacteroidota bacterium]